MVFDKNLAIRNPQWAIENSIQVPFDAVKNKYFFYVADFTTLFRFVFFLEQIFTAPAGKKARSMEDDQFQIFKSLEGALQATGVDGKTCLLRTICELQKNPVGKYSMIGEIITILLTPRRGLNDFLHEYVEAEIVGQSEDRTCESVYKGCPVSVFNLLRQYSLPSDKPKVNKTADEEHGHHDEEHGHEQGHEQGHEHGHEHHADNHLEEDF